MEKEECLRCDKDLAFLIIFQGINYCTVLYCTRAMSKICSCRLNLAITPFHSQIWVSIGSLMYGTDPVHMVQTLFIWCFVAGAVGGGLAQGRGADPCTTRPPLLLYLLTLAQPVPCMQGYCE